MTVQSLKSRQRKGKIIVGAGWHDDGSIRYVIYEDAPRRGCENINAESGPKKLRGALAEQRDLFGGS